MTLSVDPRRMSPAEQLLWGYGVTDPGHIDLEAIAYDHGAEVKYRPLGGCEARLVVVDDRAIISVASSSGGGRQRFSLAHELAHWLCDRDTGSFQCAKEDIGPENAEAKKVEDQANGYASQLILPTYLVDPWIQGRKASLETASSLGDAFRSSLTAAAIKLVRRSAAPVCLACHSQTKLRWRQQSFSFPDGFYLVPELHCDTDAFLMAFGAASGMSRARRQPANLWFTGKDAYRLEVTAQSLKLPDDTVLTMLALEK